MTNTTTEADRLLTQAEAAERLGLTPRFLEARRHRGGGPAFVRISAPCIRYRPADLEDYVAERIRTSTADPGTGATDAAYRHSRRLNLG